MVSRTNKWQILTPPPLPFHNGFTHIRGFYAVKAAEREGKQTKPFPHSTDTQTHAQTPQ